MKRDTSWFAMQQSRLSCFFHPTLSSYHRFPSSCNVHQAPLPSFLDLLLMKYSRYLGHPFFPSAAEELSLRWQIAWTVQCSCHDISKILHRRLTNLQNPAAACRTELSMQHGTATIVGFMYSGLLRVGSVRERRHWNFCCEAESCAEEFLS